MEYTNHFHLQAHSSWPGVRRKDELALPGPPMSAGPGADPVQGSSGLPKETAPPGECPDLFLFNTLFLGTGIIRKLTSPLA